MREPEIRGLVQDILDCKEQLSSINDY